MLAKAAHLLDLLADHGELTVQVLADRASEPRSSVYRLLAGLRDVGFVEPGSRRGTYRLGLWPLRLASVVVSRFDERQAALPVMERLHAETEETVFLSVRRGRDAVCIERIEGRWVQSMALLLGGSLPLHIGAGPRALLASEHEAAWEEYLAAGPLEPYTPNSPVTRPALLAELRAARDAAAVELHLQELRTAAGKSGPDANVLYPMKAALRARATVGEVCHALRDVWGRYIPPDSF